MKVGKMADKLIETRMKSKEMEHFFVMRKQLTVSLSIKTVSVIQGNI